MTDATASNPLKPELQAWFDAWKSCVQDALSQVSGQPHIFEAVFEPFPPADSDLRYTITAAGTVQGEMALRLSPPSALRLTRKFLGQPEPPAEGAAPETVTPENLEALQELLRQIAGLASTSIGSNVGGQVQLALTRADAPWAGASDAMAILRTRDEAGGEIALEIRISPALATSLASRVSEASAGASAAAEAAGSPPAPPASAPVSPAAQASPPSPSSASASSASGPAAESGVRPAAPTSSAPEPDPNTANYRRLFDVGLGVKLRFGTRHMLLRDVLALSSGLVVELDNQLNSPVDLLLDGRVIARGDVVVIDGKYGLRVTDVVDPSPSPGTPV